MNNYIITCESESLNYIVVVDYCDTLQEAQQKIKGFETEPIYLEGSEFESDTITNFKIAEYKEVTR